PVVSLQEPIPSTIPLEGRGGAVRLPAVELDDHSSFTPDAVAFEPAAVGEEVRVDLGRRQTALFDEREKARLELAPGKSHPLAEDLPREYKRCRRPPASLRLAREGARRVQRRPARLRQSPPDPPRGTGEGVVCDG